jgi:hypothetical protein
VPHSLAFLALTTAELGLITTATVGVAAAGAPAFTAWANRRHERELEHSRRLYAQRHGAYLELVRFLEHERLILHRTERAFQTSTDPLPPDPLSDEDWLNVRTQWTAFASDTVQAALIAAGERFGDFRTAVINVRIAHEQGPVFRGSLVDLHEKVDDTRAAADEGLTAAQHAMNTELASL